MKRDPKTRLRELNSEGRRLERRWAGMHVESDARGVIRRLRRIGGLIGAYRQRAQRRTDAS